MIRNMLIALMAAALSGCGANLQEIGKEPAMSPVGSGMTTGSIATENYPQPPPEKSAALGRSSLWNDSQSRLFTDPRALVAGDLLTVRIAINDRANFKNESDRSRTAARSLDLGISGDWNGAGGSAAGSGDIGSDTSTESAGETTRSENLLLSVAAVVQDVLPNGNLVIKGSQEVRVNAELRVLTIAGIVRPKDIGPDNTISYERIAEARVSYGGRGRLTEVQQPPYGQQFLDQVLPF
jgi:flagellar L-ring protein precursor FlgH